MKVVTLVVLLALAPVAALADGYHGCIVNNTGRAEVGTVNGDMGDVLPFQVAAGGSVCMNVDPGTYTVTTQDGLYSASFSASMGTKVPFGDSQVDWLVTLQ